MVEGLHGRMRLPLAIRRCRAELVAAARMAVREGVPIANLTSIADLLHPDVAERVIDGGAPNLHHRPWLEAPVDRPPDRLPG